MCRAELNGRREKEPDVDEDEPFPPDTYLVKDVIDYKEIGTQKFYRADVFIFLFNY